METREFGEATLYRFENVNGLVMEVSDFGAILHELIVPDKAGNMRDVILGYDSPDEYKGPSRTGFGATIGRNANRISGACFTLNQTLYKLDKNNNENNLHSGWDFYHYRMWNVKNTTENSITFLLHSPDGDQGYPGMVDICVTYTLTNENELWIEYHGIPTKDTILNMTNHNYFNLNGHASGSVLEQKLWVDADSFTPTDIQLVPTGEIVSVEGTPMDFREKKPIGRDIEKEYEALVFGDGYDHNWCLNNQGKFSKVAELSSDLSGITMEVYTELPGLQIFTGNSLNRESGKHGAIYNQHQGVCLETQHYPDAINHQNFPSPICEKGKVYNTKTIYKFMV